MFALCEVYKMSYVHNGISKVVCFKHTLIGDILSTKASNYIPVGAFS